MNATNIARNPAQQIGQLFMVGFHGTEPSPQIVEMIRDEQIGGVILFTRNIQNGTQLRRLTGDLQTIARQAGHAQPLLITLDQENGLVRRLGSDATVLPGNMALGATRDEDLTAAVAEASGQELRAAGINLNLAPVADVNVNPANPVIGTRSFGADPALVARLTAASVRGYHAAGMMTTLKHFPGHGDTATDSHLALPVVPFGRERLAAVELPPFVAGIVAGTDCVMTAHLQMPQIEPDPRLPASLSPHVIQGLLRTQLGFAGAVMTDCLEMQAISGSVGIPLGAVLALRAGNDLVLISHTFDQQHAALEAVRAAIAQGEIAPDMIQHALARVQRLKASLRWDDAAPLPDLVAQARLSAMAYARSTTLVTNSGNLLPLHLQPQQQLAVIAQSSTAISQAVDIVYDHAHLVAEVAAFHPALLSSHLPADAPEVEQRQALEQAGKADVTLLVLCNARQDSAQARLVREILALGRPVIGIAAGDPYDLSAFPDLTAGIATYEYSPAAMDAAVRVIFGASLAEGMLPTV